MGEYVNGKPEGKGQYTWENGSFYVGEFKGGLKHGKGKWRRSKDNNSNQYEGEYKGDKKNGYGEFTWASGNQYKGGYKDDEREGFGKMKWTDGSTYEGDWVRGIQHGKGKMTFPDGSVKDGYFEHNVYIGKNIPKNDKKSPKNQISGKTQQFGTFDNKSDSGRSTSRSRKKYSSKGLNNTNKLKKHLLIRNNSNSSSIREKRSQLDNSDSHTGYINENNGIAPLIAGGIKKPIQKQSKTKNLSDTNSSFDDNASSPYMNPERDYMLQ